MATLRRGINNVELSAVKGVAADVPAKVTLGPVSVDALALPRSYTASAGPPPPRG
jgi:hypothetical protein